MGWAFVPVVGTGALPGGVIVFQAKCACYWIEYHIQYVCSFSLTYLHFLVIILARAISFVIFTWRYVGPIVQLILTTLSLPIVCRGLNTSQYSGCHGQS